MDTLRLSAPQIDFEYNKLDNMHSSITLYNDTQHPIAYKFKATNLNIFLVRPPLGVVQQKQCQIVNITLHSKVLENNSIKDFNEKLQLITTIVPQEVQDAGPIFLDKMRRFENRKINIAILTKDRKIVAQSSGNSNQMFQSVNKQFGQVEPTRVIAIPTADKAKIEAEYFCNKFEVLQQEVTKKEKELQDVQQYNNSLIEKEAIKPKSGKLDKLIFLLSLIVSFFLSLHYQNQILQVINL
ncbi:unnamed protein product [Paramecium pentaurelia]|uniref:MSP domain-containing protein n=1 Tax=Paramecium pentaurelia TaxID=43138 RepID=A0A8S1V5E6_9CILI|nr:unnamed protein product [Paramecium pentaurelia]